MRSAEYGLVCLIGLVIAFFVATAAADYIGESFGEIAAVIDGAGGGDEQPVNP